ncbi:MAG: D-glycero-beta-D-manno-heptose-7-phosphate kinase [Oscillospiraceae bacterium]|nr:D-glycero-beta-D-manno-heptose-7-phosphate kinase [Oscillospiraceae bacterium]
MTALDNLNNVTVLVAGDFMLDKYYYGDITRLSPEAPVPVVNVQGERCVPGGAANVVNNLCRLGCKVKSFGIIGDDTEGKILSNLLNDAHTDTNFLLHDESYKTIIKTRIVGNNNHQIARLDFNENYPFPATSKLLESLDAALENCNIAILSDYDKGFCNEETTKTLISACKKYNIPLIIDPKGKNWNKYNGASWIAPNFSEFSEMIGKSIKNTDEDISDNIAIISSSFTIENVLVTRSEQGMTLYNGEKIYHIRSIAREVFDVSGAGDTVVAVLAALLGAGVDKQNAVEIANTAAGIAVGKSGTATVSKGELAAELQTNRNDKALSKIMSWDMLFSRVEQWKSENKTIAVANGCFDILHRGHTSLINAASQCADILIMAINTDETVRKLKGDSRPINSENDRAYVLAALESVDAVVIFGEDTPEELLSHILPDVLVKGAEYTLEQVPGRQYSKRVELVEYIDGYSTTAIVNKSKNG